jgi:hypothetical protein
MVHSLCIYYDTGILEKELGSLVNSVVKELSVQGKCMYFSMMVHYVYMLSLKLFSSVSFIAFFIILFSAVIAFFVICLL